MSYARMTAGAGALLVAAVVGMFVGPTVMALPRALSSTPAEDAAVLHMAYRGTRAPAAVPAASVIPPRAAPVSVAAAAPAAPRVVVVSKRRLSWQRRALVIGASAGAGAGIGALIGGKKGAAVGAAAGGGGAAIVDLLRHQ